MYGEKHKGCKRNIKEMLRIVLRPHHRNYGFAFTVPMKTTVFVDRPATCGLKLKYKFDTRAASSTSATKEIIQ